MFPTLTHIIGGRTDFSLGQSIVDPTKLIQELAGYDEVESITVADHCVINALPKVYSAKTIKPVKINFGAVVRVCDDLAWRKAGRGEKKTKNPFFCPRLIARNWQGIQDIMNLLSLANDEDHFYMQAQVSMEELIECADKGNVIVTSGDLFSLFGQADFAKRLKQLVNAVDRSNLRFELIPVNSAYYDRISEIALRTSIVTKTELIVTRPILYLETDHVTRDAVACTVNRSKMTEIFRQSISVTNLHPLRQDQIQDELVAMCNRLEIRGLGRHLIDRTVEEAVNNTNALTHEFGYKFEPLDISLPNMAANPFAEMCKIVMDGWKARIDKETFGYKPDQSLLPVYKERLKYELGVLKDMGFENYFLLVHKVVHWSRTNDIMVGPGRGSVGGSLVAYLMGITDVDPIRFGLIFERFINPERLDLPDADLDFMSSRRGEVIDMLFKEFGDEYVCGISNYGVMGASSSLRRIGAAFDLPATEYDCSKLVPKEHGNSLSLTEGAEQVGALQIFQKKYPHIWDIAVRAQGVFNIYGQHAAGIVVAGDKVQNRAVVETRAGGRLCNWDKDVVEKFGLVKLDILGLSNLDVLRIAKEYIEERHGITVDYEDVPLDDPDVLAAFGEGKTNAIFQFEGGGAKSLLKSIAQNSTLSFEDLVAISALNRPGPMDAGLTEQFVSIKSGYQEEIYPHALTKDALKETYGVMCYQEQTMRVSRDLAGFSMAEADKLRKAIGKKDPVLMASLRDQFVEGAVAGQIEVEMEDGSKIIVHRKSKFKCADGVFRTVEEAAALDVDIDVRVI